MDETQLERWRAAVIEAGKRFALYAAAKDGNLTWSCRSIDLETKYLPSACRQ